MWAWFRPTAWATGALAAAWLRRFVADERVDLGLTILALFSAVSAAIFVLELVGGRKPTRGRPPTRD